MADQAHLAILMQGVKVWNKWRRQNPDVKPDLSGTDLNEADLREANLREVDLWRTEMRKTDLKRADLCGASLIGALITKADLSGANLIKANLSEATLIEADLCGALLIGSLLIKADLMGADLMKADLSEADLSGADLSDADLSRANLNGTNLSGAILREADLYRAILNGANLQRANLSGAVLSGANLREANLAGATLQCAAMVETNADSAIFTNCKIYGLSAWNIKTNKKTIQSNLIITKDQEPVIAVDNIKIAQFIYFLLYNAEIKDVITTLSHKAVLILGRFEEKKIILDVIADELRARNYLPIMYDFDRPVNSETSETIKTLAGLCKFVIADFSFPSSILYEATSILQFFEIPFVPLIEESQRSYSMHIDYRKYPWVLSVLEYKDVDHIKSMIDEKILLSAEGKFKQIKKIK